MGFDPDQVDRMSVWKFTACVDGYAKANGVDQTKNTDISDEQARRMGIEGF